eukprot:TRINITY_DN2566_c0_g1_i9.p2 TRINITY_DN2566_c0_g1~~TRINITY_DN2566_c0_g1_i9.p2  ORF type:complete len:113 (-),score=33.62 TRINITY_DN2566_c0_g1_i9:385-723(-)
MAELLDQYSDNNIQDEHMKYSHLQMESVGRLQEFMSGPLQKDLACVPGIGPKTIEKLNEIEIFTLTQLMGKFMSLDRECARMLQWLEEHDLCGRFAETCVHALAMKLHFLLD